MTAYGQSIADEVEAAIQAGSTERRLDAARRVTNLFLASAGSFSGEQVELFDHVLARLITAIEGRSIADINARAGLAEISTQLAPIAQAPPSVIGHLARHDDISIAAPVLRESPRLSDQDLIDIAKTSSEQHLLAVAGRWWLKEAVTDALLGRHYPSVSRRIVGNPGARVSERGFATIVAHAESDDELAVEAGIRVDLPPALRHQLLSHATEEVRKRLLSRAPSHLFEEIRSAIAAVAAGADREMSRARDFAAARRLVGSLVEKGELNETAILEFARQRRYEETVVALAELSKSVIEVIRPLMQSLRDDGVVAACRAAGLNWETTSAILACRYSTGSPDAAELAKAKIHFVKTSAEDARRMLAFWRVRSPPAPSRTN